MLNIGIDLGGTKTEIIALSSDGKELYRKRIASPQGDYQGTLDTLCNLVNDAEQTLGSQANIGLGIPGSINKNNQQVKNSNSDWINGQALQVDLEARLQRSIKIENDANCFALSEALDGAGEKHSSIFGVIIGTGCGGGFYHQGELISGKMGLGGEWGHNPLPFPLSFAPEQAKQLENFFDRHGKASQSEIYRHKASIPYVSQTLEEAEYPGPLCYCGKRGCLETWISGTGFSHDHYRVYGEKVSAEELSKLAQDGHSNAQLSLFRYCERLAKSLAQVINIFDPDIIILGGGMSNASVLYQEIPQRWDKFIFSDEVTTKLAPAKHGDASGVRGAAQLWSR